MVPTLLEAEMLMSDVHSRGGTMVDLAKVVCNLTNGLVYVLDPDEHIIARALPPQVEDASIPCLARLLGEIGSLGEPPLSATAIAPDTHLGTRRYVLAPVRYDGRLFAYLVLAAPVGAEQDRLLWIANRASAHLRGEFLAQRRLARVAWNARANLARQMIRGTSYDADLRACAEYLGVDIDAERVVAFVLERGRSSGSTVDPGRLSELMVRELEVEVLPIRATEGVLLAVKVPESHQHQEFVSIVKGALVRGLEQMGDEFAVAGLSSVTPAGQLRRAYREAREVARCLDRYAGRDTRAIGCDELGPARLFVANSDEHAVRTYVHDVLGQLLNGDETSRLLLLTLQAFFDGGRNIRKTAVALGVHENTVRHRLMKVHEFTGLDVASRSNDQLSVQTALLVLRLQGHHAVPAFDRGTVSRRPQPA